jgi:hypothetical protein
MFPSFTASPSDSTSFQCDLGGGTSLSVLGTIVDACSISPEFSSKTRSGCRTMLGVRRSKRRRFRFSICLILTVELASQGREPDLAERAGCADIG